MKRTRSNEPMQRLDAAVSQPLAPTLSIRCKPPLGNLLRKDSCVLPIERDLIKVCQPFPPVLMGVY